MDSESIINEATASTSTEITADVPVQKVDDKHVEEPIAKEEAPGVAESMDSSSTNVEVQNGKSLEIPLKDNVEVSSEASSSQMVVNNEKTESENKADESETKEEVIAIEVEQTCNESINAETAEISNEKTQVVEVTPKESKTPEQTEAGEQQTTKDASLQKSSNAKVQGEPQTVEEMDITENNATPIETSKPATGLGLLSQYDSDVITDSEDDVVEVPATAVSRYRSKVIEVNSDSSSDDSSDSDVEYLNEIRKTIDKRIGPTEEDDEDDDEDDGEGGKQKKKRQPPKVRGEQTLDELPPIHELQITVPEEECVELGKINSIVEQLVLVSVLPNSVLLDLDTVLFLDKGKRVLGEVFDVLGQVSDPLYCVRFNTNTQIMEKGIQVGDVVYVAPKTQYTQFVILSNLMKIRGSDASWEHDVEPPPRYLDYSDDEEEREARASLRNKNRPTDHDEPTKRSRNERDEDEAPSHGNRPGHPSHRGRGGARGGGGGGGGNYQQRPPTYGPNHNRASWHSNYYPHAPPPQQPYHGGYHAGHPGHQYAQAPNYQMPPQYPQPHNYHHPPPYGYQGLPQFEGRYPYGGGGGGGRQGPPPTADGNPHMTPMYVPNPYAIRPPILQNQTPPMHPNQPHQMPPGGGH